MATNNLVTAGAATVPAPPLIRLPQDVLLAICGFGTSAGIDADTTASLSRTCKALRDRLVPVLYRDIWWSGLTRGILYMGPLCRAVIVSPHARELAGMIRSLDIQNTVSNMPDVRSWTKLKNRMRDLMAINMWDGRITGNDILLVCLLAHATNLSRVKLIGPWWSTLKFEFLLRRHERTHRNLGGRISFPQVTNLHIGGYWSSAARDKLCCNNYDGLLWCLPNLTTLHVSNAGGFASITARFPALATLKLSDCDITPGGLDRLLRYSPALRRFEWRHNYTLRYRRIMLSQVIDCLSKHHAATLEELLLSYTAHAPIIYHDWQGPDDRAKIPDDIGTKLTGIKQLSVEYPNFHICSAPPPQADGSGSNSDNVNANNPDRPRHHDTSELVKLYRRVEPTLEDLYISGINTSTFPSTVVTKFLDTIVKEAKGKMERPKLSKIWLQAGDGSPNSKIKLDGDGARDEWQALIGDVQARHGAVFTQFGMDVRLDFWDTPCPGRRAVVHEAGVSAD